MLKFNSSGSGTMEIHETSSLCLLRFKISHCIEMADRSLTDLSLISVSLRVSFQSQNRVTILSFRRSPINKTNNIWFAI